MSIDEKAFHRAWEVVGWDTQNPHAETGQRRFIAAYEAAKAKEQPVGLSDIAKEIAEYANKCCHRSDGYEEDIAAFVKHRLRETMSPNYKERIIESLSQAVVAAMGQKGSWSGFVDDLYQAVEPFLQQPERESVEVVKNGRNCLCFPTQVCDRSCGMWTS